MGFVPASVLRFSPVTASMLNFRGPGWEQLRADYAKLRVHSRRRRICHNQHHICNTPSDRAEVSWRYGRLNFPDILFCIFKCDRKPSDFHSASLQLVSSSKSFTPKSWAVESSTQLYPYGHLNWKSQARAFTKEFSMLHQDAPLAKMGVMAGQSYLAIE